jgi:ssDNA-binding Zn-finger/Zn-ribbon topoisomerase 1
MSERKPVICPWCGWEMVAREGQDIFHGKYNAYVCEGCETVSPIAYSEDAAYAAATNRASDLPKENS